MMECNTVRKLSHDDVKLYTDNFSESNFIGRFQWGRVFHGRIGVKPVVVKKWEVPPDYTFFEGDNVQRLQDEIFLFEKHPEVSSHPNLAKLIGYCDESEEQQAAVYDIQAEDILDNLVVNDNFTWLQRIKVILGLGRVIEFLHTLTPLPCVLRNISTSHVLVDKDFNAKLFDFGMVTGGIFPDRRLIPRKQYVHGCHGFINWDPRAPGCWSYKVDVFAFGTLMLMLIGKKVVTEEERLNVDCDLVFEWADNVYEPSQSCTIVHKSFQLEKDFSLGDGDRIERLAYMRCVGSSITRINMKTALKEPVKLKAVKRILGEKELACLKRYLTVTSHVA